MLGKGAILTVFGFILAFSMYQVRMSSNVMATADNFNTEYMETLIHETALSAMNLAINKVWDTGATLDSFTYRANHCTSRVNIFPVGTDTTQIRVRTWATIYDPDLQEFQTREESMSAFFANTFNSITDYFMFTNNSGGGDQDSVRVTPQMPGYCRTHRYRISKSLFTGTGIGIAGIGDYGHHFGALDMAATHVHCSRHDLVGREYGRCFGAEGTGN